MKEESIIIELPMPPSVNTLFAWKVRRYKSDKYKAWILEAINSFNKIPTKYNIKWDEWLEVHLNYFFSSYTKKWDKRIKDTDNYCKATLDFLCDNIEGLQDHKIKRIIQEKHDSDKNIVKILIKEMPNEKNL